MNIRALLSQHRFIPIAAFADEHTALKAAELLSQHSIGILEITIRTPAALDCLHAVGKRFPDMALGAGSILNRVLMEKAIDKGARFGLSPCFIPELFRTACELSFDLVPGIATPSELFAAWSGGARMLKLFPAESLGGPAYIRSISAPFTSLDFSLVPTGGITAENIEAYMKTERVIACGSSSIIDETLLSEGRFC